MVIEGVSIQGETSRGRSLVTSEVLVLACPKVSQASRRSRWRRRCPGPFDGGDGTSPIPSTDSGLLGLEELR
jgi:hypothetical protein